MNWNSIYQTLHPYYQPTQSYLEDMMFWRRKMEGIYKGKRTYLKCHILSF